MKKPIVRIVLAWACLIALLLASLGSAYLKLGSGNLIASLLIALLKAAMVMAAFMKLGDSPRMVRLVIAACVGVLTLLLALGSVDFATRESAPASWQSPKQIVPAVDQLSPPRSTLH